jgi:hypothetical protein
VSPDHLFGSGKSLFHEPHEAEVAVGHARLRRRARQALPREIVGHDAAGLAANAIAGKHQPLDLIQARRGGDDTAGQSL